MRTLVARSPPGVTDDSVSLPALRRVNRRT
jgi:hypothetical protein